MKLTNVQMTAACRAYASKHGYSIASVRTTSELRYAAAAAYQEALEARQQAYAAMDEEEQAYRDYADRWPAPASSYAGHVAPPASAFIVSNAEAARLMERQRAAGWSDESGEALRCACGELADSEMAEVVRNGKHVLVHVNGCMLPGDLLA